MNRTWSPCWLKAPTRIPAACSSGSAGWLPLTTGWPSRALTARTISSPAAELGLQRGWRSALLPPDLRYIRGDPSLDLPGNYALFRCYPTYRNCDKAFAPLDLAMFYARLYQGKVLGKENTARWLEWMDKDRNDAALSQGLPAGMPVRAFVKNGFRHSDEGTPIHFYHEAGVIETPRGIRIISVYARQPRLAGIKATGGDRPYHL